MASFANPTSIYIDLVPGYKNLSACAEVPVSTMIRNMWNGCGDDSKLTSFSCFCTDSYSKFSWDISTAVIASCGPEFAPAQATSAVSVFHNYCANGTTQLTTATSVMATGSSSSSASRTVSAVPGKRNRVCVRFGGKSGKCTDSVSAYIPAGAPTSIITRIAPEPTEAATASAAIHNHGNESKLWLLLFVSGAVLLRILFLR